MRSSCVFNSYLRDGNDEKAGKLIIKNKTHDKLVVVIRKWRSFRRRRRSCTVVAKVQFVKAVVNPGLK